MNIDRFYRVENNSLVFPGIEKDKLQVGDVFNISNSLITDGFHGNDRQLYFYEYCEPGKNVLIMTNRKGQKQFAVATNDCVRDNFPENCLAKVLIEVGNYIIHTFPEVSSGRRSNINRHVVNVFKVIEVSPNVRFCINTKISINVRLIDRLVLTTHHSVKENLRELREAVRHSLLVSRKKTDDFTTPKYCFNPGRVVTNRLFHRNEEGELISFNDEGKRLILNKNSPEGLTNVNGVDKRVENIFLRCFYSKKLSDEEVIFVDGAPLSVLQQHELNDYIEESNITREMASTILKKAITYHNQSFFVVVNVKGEIRPIYKNSYGYATFPLNEKEQEFIKVLEDLKF